MPGKRMRGSEEGEGEVEGEEEGFDPMAFYRSPILSLLLIFSYSYSDSWSFPQQ